jgi:hypothetical protein
MVSASAMKFFFVMVLSSCWDFTPVYFDGRIVQRIVIVERLIVDVAAI